MTEFLQGTWPWYVAGPLIGLIVPLMLILGNKALGISSNLRHICAACLPQRTDYFRYDWKQESWNLIFVLGIFIGAFIGYQVMGHPAYIDISDDTVRALSALGVEHSKGFLPHSIFSFENLLTPTGIIIMVIGGLLIGFGTRMAGGCTSGHAITGLSNLKWPSLVAVIGFFAGGLFATHVLLPWIL